uniref:hypothetical protein n=1 Tax=Paenibacillus xylanexedens TaxID=528191 RepID=UPI001C92EC99
IRGGMGRWEGIVWKFEDDIIEEVCVCLGIGVFEGRVKKVSRVEMEELGFFVGKSCGEQMWLW